MNLNSYSRLVVLLKGIAMGVADIIPGVSGGTIAIITGVYEEFLSSLNKLDFKIFNLLIKFRFKKVWQDYNLSFLITLALGIILSIFIFSNYIPYLIQNYSITLWSFFLGLIISSIYYLQKEIVFIEKKLHYFTFSKNLILLFFGISLAVFVLLIKPTNINPTPTYLFFSGMISITAMLLPGISGAYILILLGSYEIMLKTINEVIKFNTEYFLNFFSFVCGAIISVKLFSKFLTWAYKKNKNQTLSCLIGFMIGSLPSIWPWKNDEISDLFYTNLYIPSPYIENDYFFIGLCFILIGFFMVIFLQKISENNEKKK